MKPLFRIVVLLVALCMAANATILTFDLFKNSAGTLIYTNGWSIPTVYGDNVTADSVVNPDSKFVYGVGSGFTPNVTVSMDARRMDDNSIVLGSLQFYKNWSPGVNVAYSTAGAGTYRQITLTAAPGYRVKLNSFDIAYQDGWVVKGVPIRINAVGSTLDTQSNVISTVQSGIEATEIVIQFGFNDTRVAIDNVNFEQSLIPTTPPPTTPPTTGGGSGDPGSGGTPPPASAVPEPGTLLVAGAALAGLGIWRRRA